MRIVLFFWEYDIFKSWESSFNFLLNLVQESTFCCL